MNTEKINDLNINYHLIKKAESKCREIGITFNEYLN